MTPQERTMAKICTPLLAVLATAALVATQAQAQTPTPAASSAPVAAPANAALHPPKRPGAVPQKTLDLHAPPLSHIYPSRQLQYILATDESEADAAGEVSVQGTRRGVVVPGTPGNQLQAIPWAIFHPTQAWRIFTPLEQP
jgi:hypothetical protein